MKRFRILRTALLLPVAMIGLACSDFLELEPEQSVSDGAYFTAIGDFRAAIVGVYDQISIADYYGRSLHLMSDIMGEDVKQTGSANRYQEFADFEGQAVSGHNFERELWAEGYEAINMLNMMINAEYAAPSADVQAELDQILGEAYALRGLVYFDMVKMYAQHYTYSSGASHPGVAIVLESDVTVLPSRATVAEVYAQIISDFGTGMSMMTTSRAGPHMMSDDAVQALLSRVYLYMEDFSNAAANASAIINSGRYDLVTAGAYVDQFVTGGSSEAIFEITYNGTDNNGSDCLGCMYTANGYGDYLPAKDLLDHIDPADIRMGMFKLDTKLTGAYASLRVNKWPTPTQTDNVPVIRLSELYLNRAEARARSGDSAGAQADLIVIRERALGVATPVTSTGQALLDEILIERRIELGYEGHRIHDLMRHKQAVNRVDVTGDVAFMGYPCDFCILPIPFEERDANENMTQNQGYPTG